MNWMKHLFQLIAIMWDSKNTVDRITLLQLTLNRIEKDTAIIDCCFYPCRFGV